MHSATTILTTLSLLLTTSSATTQPSSDYGVLNIDFYSNFPTSSDPPSCSTIDFSQYFSLAPTPTNLPVLDALNSYGGDQATPCRETAADGEGIYCTISNPSQWCGFTTAAPQDVLSAYSADYLSSAVDYWTKNSKTISELVTACKDTWMYALPAEHEWIKIAKAHAECFLYQSGHQESGSPTSAVAVGSGAEATTTGVLGAEEAKSGSGRLMSSVVLMGFAVVVLVACA